VYTIEEKYEGNYSYKRYWEPGIYKNLPESGIIAHFVERFQTISNYYALTAPVYNTRPFRIYGVGCGVAGIKILTRKELIEDIKYYRRKKQIYTDNKKREALLTKPK
jgi:hypothetical protein